MSEARPRTSLTPLPLDEAWASIDDALSQHRNLILVAEPGAGKTTRFPPHLLHSGKHLNHSGPNQVLMLEPRRLAARAAAHRIAEEQGWRLGDEVGYQVRFENRTSRDTRLTVLTEGLLTRKIESDPELRNVGCVILDEFHERSLHTDLAIGMLYELQELARPDLRIVVMSATLDAERVSAFLGGAPIVRVPGRTYPVEVKHAPTPLSLDTGLSFLDRVASTIFDALEGRQKRIGDILVFLPGAREIRGVRDRVTERAERLGVAVVELHGSLALEDQDRAIRKLDRPKVVLATNIAETSLTIDGVGTVIDSGLARVMRIDALGFPRLSLSRISLASATQRSGRAGRQEPGLCYRLWSKLDEGSMPAFEQPEILRSDLSEARLALASQGINDAEAFSWFERPKDEALTAARELLLDLGFIDQNGALTTEGREAVKLPVPVRVAKLLLEAVREGQLTLGAELAALLTEKDVLLSAREAKRLSHAESDVLLRLHLLHEGGRGSELDRFAVRNVKRVAELLENAASRVSLKSLQRRFGTQDNWSRGLSPDEIACRLLLIAFPDRLCRRRRPKEPAARMVGGKGFDLAPFSTVETAELFLALDASEPFQAKRDLQVTLASRIERSWLELHFPEVISANTQIVFNADTGMVQKQKALSFHDLPLEAPQVSRPSDDEAFEHLIQAALERWETAFASRDDLKRLAERWNFVRAHHGDADWPSLGDYRRLVLEEACFGESRLEAVQAKPLGEIFLRHLPADAVRTLEGFAPESFTVPSGNRMRIHYPEARDPFLEVRIQEIFGLQTSPKVAQGQVPVVFHLLGPNFRPVQVTADLASFWKTGYSEVRKELRARYPKHSWPENPLDAKPEAKGGRRRE